MEPIGICGGGAVLLTLLLVAVVGLAVFAGGLVAILAKLGVIVNRAAHHEESAASDTITLKPGQPLEGGKDDTAL